MPQVSTLHIPAKPSKLKLKSGLIVGFMGAVVLFLGALEGEVVADDTIFLMPPLTVQEKGSSEVEAKKTALIKAKRQAYQYLVDMLVPARQQNKIPHLSDKQLEDLVYTTDIPSERMSQGAGLYVADIQIGFRPDLIRNFFKTRGIAFSETRGRPLLLLPVLIKEGDSVLWEDRNDWRLAWANSNLLPGLITLERPLGDISDIGDITVDEALALNQQKLMAIAEKYGAAGVVLTFAEAGKIAATGQHMLSVRNILIADGWADDLTVYDFAEDMESLEVGAPDVTGATEALDNDATTVRSPYADLYAKAIEVVYSSLQERWKENNLIDPNVRGNSLMMVIPLAGLQEWLDIRAILDEMTMIQYYNIVSVAVSEAIVAIEYSGRTDSLRSALKQLNYDLVFDAETAGWILLKN